MKLENNTPFEAGNFVLQDQDGKDLLIVVVKATYGFDHSGSLTLSDEQEPVAFADQYFGSVEETGIKYASDITFGKEATDIALIGHAVAGKEKQRKSFVIFNVGTIKKKVAVFGDRHWKSTLGFKRISKPEPFSTIRLVYENAFGGNDLSHKNPKKHEFEQKNTIGKGFRAKKSRLKTKEINLPNLEDPENLIKSFKSRPAPSSLGFISPHWQPRMGFAGTYDEHWQKNRMPLLPEDFDTKYNQAAHPDLIYPGFLEGNENVLIAGVSEKGPYEFSLPDIRPACRIELSGEEHHPEINIEKLVINTDEEKAFIVWHCSLDIHDRLYDVETIECSLETEDEKTITEE